ncbi:phage filamentation protein Fil family protein [Huaxiibacter chinensis]
MLRKETSFTSLLVKESQAMHCGHGWIIGEQVNANTERNGRWDNERW